MNPLILTSIVSSALYVFSFAPWSTHIPSLSFLQLIALVPLLIALSQKNYSLRKTFLAGFIVALGITLGGFYWIIYAVQQYGGLPYAAAVGVFAAFCLIAQLQVPLYLVFRKKALEKISPQKWVLISGLIYAGIESFYPKLFLDTAGHAFSAQLYFSQLADIGSVFFITMLTVTFAEAVALAATGILKKKNESIEARTTQLVHSLQEWALPALILIFGLGYGAFRVHQIESMLNAQSQKPALHVGVVQANIGDYLKIAAEQGLNDASDQVINEYLKYSSLVIEKNKQLNGVSPDAIVWPETAYSALFGRPMRHDERRMEERLRDFASTFSGTMIFGGYDQEGRNFDYNSVFFLPGSEAKQATKTKAYHKNMLLMFGETLPFADTFPAMKSWFPTMGFFGRGPGPEVYSVKNAAGNEFKLAPSICYEGLFPYYSAVGAELGADALLNVTNDSWFGPDGEPYLHFALTRFRSIETRLPMIRSTNTGISAAIDPLGRIESETGLFVSDVLNTTVHPRLGITTPYQAMAAIFGGQWFERLCQIVVLLAGAWVWKKKRVVA